MIGILVTGHGNIASGFKSGLNLVYGEVENFEVLDFVEGMSSETLEKKIEEKLNVLNKGKGVLILSDIAGGTPFKVSSLISLKTNDIKVISGTNFPMLLEVISERDDRDLISLYEYALKEGANEVKGFELKDRKDEYSDDDGI